MENQTHPTTAIPASQPDQTLDEVISNSEFVITYRMGVARREKSDAKDNQKTGPGNR
jgi:hypothetical protein